MFGRCFFEGCQPEVGDEDCPRIVDKKILGFEIDDGFLESRGGPSTAAATSIIQFTILDDFSSPLSLRKRGGGLAINWARFQIKKKENLSLMNIPSVEGNAVRMLESLEEGNFFVDSRSIFLRQLRKSLPCVDFRRLRICTNLLDNTKGPATEDSVGDLFVWS